MKGSSKMWKKIVAVALIGAMVVSVVQIRKGSGQSFLNKFNTSEKTLKVAGNEDSTIVEEKDSVNHKASQEEDKKFLEKEETVMVSQNSQGEVDSIVVSDTISNIQTETLEDKSNLTNIKVISGNEEMTQNGEKIIWKNIEGELTYEGNSNKELPVNVNVSYELDGKKVVPEEILGKSGELKIVIDYENNATYKDVISGKNVSLYCPFVMMSLCVLPSDRFRNIQVSQGSVEKSGDNRIVLAYGIPGLSDNMDTDCDEEDYDMKSKLEDEFDDSITITADVTDFAIGSIYTISNSEMLNNFEFSKNTNESIEDIKESLDDLSDATGKLVKGSKSLSSGTEKMKQAFATYGTGVEGVVEAIGQFATGTKKLSDSLSTNVENVKSFDQGTRDYVKGVNQYASGVDGYIDGVDKVVSGISGAKTAADAAATAAADYGTNAGIIAGKVSALVSPELSQGMKSDTKKIENSIENIAEAGEKTKTEIQKITDIIDKLVNMKKESTEEKQKEEIQSVIDSLTAVRDAQTLLIEKISNEVAEDSDTKASITSMESNITNVEEAQKSLGTDVFQLEEKTKQVVIAMGTYSAYASGLEQGATALSEPGKTLKKSSAALKKAGKAVGTGSKGIREAFIKSNKAVRTISTGMSTMNKQTKKLPKATKKMKQSFDQLNKGSNKFTSGVKKYKTEGIDEMEDTYNDNINPIIQRLRSVTSDKAIYRNFSGETQEMNSSTTFIFQTDSVGLED